MLNSRVVWTMALNHLRRQKGQTLLSMLGSGIGVMLIVASLVFYSSFDASGNKWIDAHLGAVQWELTAAAGQEALSPEQVDAIIHHPGTETVGLSYLPLIKQVTVAYRMGGADTVLSGTDRIMVLGIPPGYGADFGLSVAGISLARLPEDQAIVSKPVATQLGLEPGDILGLRGSNGERLLFKVAAVVEEQGITGFRGREQAAGTVIMTELAVRRLSGMTEAEGQYHSVLVSEASNSVDYPTYPFRFDGVTIHDLRQDALQTLEQWKLRYGLLFALASGFAAVAGLLLMRQILLLLADYRREQYAVLRALGFRRSHIRMLFWTEAALISALGTVAGTVAGCLAGYGIVRLFQGQFAGTLAQYSGSSIPLSPYLPAVRVVLVALAIFLVLLAIAWIHGGKAGNLNIMETLRAGTGGMPRLKKRGSTGTPPSTITARSSTRRGRYQNRAPSLDAVFRWGLFTGCLAILLLHVYQLISGDAVNRLNDLNTAVSLRGLSVLALWLAASVASLVLVFSGNRWVERWFRGLTRLLGLNPAAGHLAFRYPLQNKGRTLTVALLFSLILTILVTTCTFAAPLLQFERDQAVKEMFLGYAAYVPFMNEKEKQATIQLLQQDEGLRELVTGFTTVEPYRLNLDSPETLVGKSAFSMVAVDEAWAQWNGMKLVARAPEFATDEEAWEAVRNGVGYIVLHEKYRYAASDWPGQYTREGLPIRPLKAGDRLRMRIFPSVENLSYSFEREGFGTQMTEEEAAELQKRIEQEVQERERLANTPVDERTFVIAGFVGGEEQLEYYRLLMASPQVVEQYREYGYLWPNIPYQGYVLLQFDQDNLDVAQAVKQRLLAGGVDGLNIPSLARLAEYTMSRHMLLIVGTFMVLSLVIGLSGLAIVQQRAVRERSRQVAMMRCMGIGKRAIRDMFLLEGIWISWTGIVNGVLFGTIGGYLLYQLLNASRSPHEPMIPFAYPAGLVVALLIALLSVALLQILWPASQANRLTPGEAIRVAD